MKLVRVDVGANPSGCFGDRRLLEVLREHDAAHEPDARDPGTFKRDRMAQHAVTKD